MSSDDDSADEFIPRKRRKEGEDLAPRPESHDKEGQGKRRKQDPSQSTPKKGRSETLQRETLPQPVAGNQNFLGTPGKIVRVKLNNFMCHSNFVFTFGDKINFISGKNGSGKSAILTALVLGLGGRTSDTNRGSSLAKLLKNGERRGSIEITISNDGVRSHDPVKYGNEITIVRNINERSSTYKFLSEKGEVVSQKRLELNAILMSFNVQVNNPVCILNQDTARTFLKTAPPKELYNLFRKGTLIDEIEEKLKELKDCKLPLIRSILKRKKQSSNNSTMSSDSSDDEMSMAAKWFILKYLENRRFRNHPITEGRAVYGEFHHLMPQLEDDPQKFKEYLPILANAESVKGLLEYIELVNKFSRLSTKQNEMFELQKVLSWLYVKDLEEQLINKEKKMIDTLSNIEKIKQNIESKDGSHQHLREQISELERDLQQWQGETEAIDHANIDLEQKISYHKGIFKRKIDEIKKKQKKVEIEDGRCRELQSEIDNKRSRTVEIESKTAKIGQQQNELRKRCEELNAVISTSVVNRQQLMDTVEETKNRVEITDRVVYNMERRITQLQEYLNSLVSGEKNELSVYSQWMPKLVGEIDEAHKRGLFDNKPKGPLGRFIKLKDKGWGPVVEKFIGARLSSFAVCSSKDMGLVRKIFDKLGIPQNHRPALIVTKFQDSVYDCSSTEVRHPKYKNLFRSIDVTDATVANILLDLYQPDTVLLVPTSAETYPLAQDQANVPHKCASFLNMDGTRIHPNPSYRCYSNFVAEKTRFLQVSPEEAIRTTNHDLAILKNDYDSKKHEMVNERKKLDEAKLQLQEVLKDLNTLQGQLDNCKTKLYEAEHMELPETFDENVLEEDLQFRMNLIETLKGELEILKREKNQAMESFKSEESLLTEKENVKEDLNLKIKRTAKEISELRGKLRDYSKKHDDYKEILKMEMTKREQYIERVTSLKTELVDALVTAREMSLERIESTTSKQDLELKVSELGRDVKVLKKELHKKPVKPSDYESRIEKYEQSEVSLQKVSKAVDALESNYDVLVKRMDALLDLVVSTTAFSFKKILKKRHFLGEINISHSNRTLTLNVKPDPKVQTDTNLTSLSGGESSYSMVAFIMSLWENMATPFYFLDEFDVFMDEMNRRLIMKLLISHAHDNPDKQYVFLTPHAVPVESAVDIHYFRMDDPRE